MIGVYDYTVILTYVSLLSAGMGIFISLSGYGHPYVGIFFLLVCGLCDAFDGKVARTKKNRRKRRRPDRQRERCRRCLWTEAHRAGFPFSRERRRIPLAGTAGEPAVPREPQEPGPDHPARGPRVPERGPAADQARKPGRPAAPPGDMTRTRTI